MKNFSFKLIVEEIENKKSLEDISLFIQRYFIYRPFEGYRWKEMPKNNSGFGAIILFQNNELFFLKDGDFTIERKYEDSPIWPYKNVLKSTSFDYQKGKEIPIGELSEQELEDVYNSIYNKVQSEMSNDKSKYRGD